MQRHSVYVLTSDGWTLLCVGLTRSRAARFARWLHRDTGAEVSVRPESMGWPAPLQTRAMG